MNLVNIGDQEAIVANTQEIYEWYSNPANHEDAAMKANFDQQFSMEGLDYAIAHIGQVRATFWAMQVRAFYDINLLLNCLNPLYVVGSAFLQVFFLLFRPDLHLMNWIPLESEDFTTFPAMFTKMNSMVMME